MGCGSSSPRQLEVAPDAESEILQAARMGDLSTVKATANRARSVVDPALICASRRF
jgi:hypothetical protein